MIESAGDQFPVLLNARASNPGHSYLRFRRKCRPPSAPRVRLRTLNRTSYESRNAMTNVPTAARAASALRNFSIEDLRSSRRPPAHGMRRKGILLRVHAPAAAKRNNCKHLFDSYTHGSSSSGAWPHCPGLPDVFAFSNVPNRRGDSGYNRYRKRHAPRKCSKARASSFRCC